MSREDPLTLNQKELQHLGIVAEVEAGRLSVERAAEMSGLTMRHIWRLRVSFREKGAAAFMHGNRGRASPGRIGNAVRARVKELVAGPYAGCNDHHLTELLAQREGIVLSRKSVERIRREAGREGARFTQRSGAAVPLERGARRPTSSHRLATLGWCAPDTLNVFFDLDGTLADTMPAYMVALAKLYADEFGVPEEVSRRRLPDPLKLPSAQRMSGFSELTGVDMAEYRRQPGNYEKVTAAIESAPLTLFPEVPAVLRRLWEQDYSLVLTTGSPAHGLEAGLAAANIRHYFTLVLGSHPPSGFAKGPDNIGRAEQVLGLEGQELARRALLVGDSLDDISMARAPAWSPSAA